MTFWNPYNDLALTQGYGVPFGNFITAPGHFYPRPKKHINIVKRGVAFTLEAKPICFDSRDLEDNCSPRGDRRGPGGHGNSGENGPRFIVLCTVSIPKAGMHGTAQFIQEPGQRIDEQKTIAVSGGLRDKKILSAPSLVFPEGMLSFIIDDIDYPRRVTYTCDLKLNYQFQKEIRREMYQTLTITRNKRCYDASDYCDY